MKKSRFSEAKIISVLKRNERGEKVRDLKRLKDLEVENARLKKMYANLSLVHDALKDAVEKKL